VPGGYLFYFEHSIHIFMRSPVTIIICTATCFIIACGGKSSNGPAENENLQTGQADSTDVANSETKAALATARPFLDNELSAWAKSFTGFHIDSLKQMQIGKFEDMEYESAGNLEDFVLHRPAFSYAPDSNHFIDLHSSGISLEKKGKKIIAIGDVDQSVTLCNLKTKEWRRILFFGPSAGIEEAVWASPTQFLLAGFMHNDEGKSLPILLLGDTGNKSLRWFEGNVVRPESADYKPGSMQKLKIDEWE
jgi:hypothetical protein